MVMNLNELSKVDACGTLCPVPILRAEEEIGRLRKGSLLEVSFTDSGAKEDFKSWCRATGHELVSLREDRPKYYARIRKN